MFRGIESIFVWVKLVQSHSDPATRPEPRGSRLCVAVSRTPRSGSRTCHTRSGRFGPHAMDFHHPETPWMEDTLQVMDMEVDGTTCLAFGRWSS